MMVSLLASTSTPERVTESHGVTVSPNHDWLAKVRVIQTGVHEE